MNSSYLGILVNKSHPLPDDYVPPDLVPVDVPFAYIRDDRRNYLRKPAALALENMFRDAAAAGMDLTAVSGYRSFELPSGKFMKAIWLSKAPNTPASILPKPEKVNIRPDWPWIFPHLPSIRDSPQTLRPHRKVSGSGKNAPDYGFILRYPSGKKGIRLCLRAGTSAISGNSARYSPPGESLWKNVISFYFRRKSCMI